MYWGFRARLFCKSSRYCGPALFRVLAWNLPTDTTESQLAASPCGKLSQSPFGLSGETAAREALRSFVKGQTRPKGGGAKLPV